MLKATDEVFLIGGEQLRSLPARPLRAGLFGKTLEEALQTLIEKYPEGLPGKQMDPENEDPPHFVLLRREMPIGGWSLDHLLVDQRGVLTLMETKLTQNPEARREVIGQILEYAANAVESWGNGRLREKATEFWVKQGWSVDDLLRKKFGDDLDVEDFWATVEETLEEGKLRLIVAADELRPEARRTIEYLSREMKRVQIFGLELRCYGGEEAGPMVLVPRLIGQMTRKEPADGGTLWTADRLQTAYDDLPQDAVTSRLKGVLEWAINQRCFLEARAKFPTFGLRGRGGGRVFTFLPNGTVYWYVNAQNYAGDAEERDRLFEELKRLRMVDPALDPCEVVAGRNLPRKLTDLEEREFRGLLEVFGRFCGASEKGPEVSITPEQSTARVITIEGPENTDWLQQMRTVSDSNPGTR